MQDMERLIFRVLNTQTFLHFPDKLHSYIEPFEQPFACIGGIVVSIAASQAVDPGSIPGQCKTYFMWTCMNSYVLDLVEPEMVERGFKLGN